MKWRWEGHRCRLKKVLLLSFFQVPTPSGTLQSWVGEGAIRCEAWEEEREAKGNEEGEKDRKQTKKKKWWWWEGEMPREVAEASARWIASSWDEEGEKARNNALTEKMNATPERTKTERWQRKRIPTKAVTTTAQKKFQRTHEALRRNGFFFFFFLLPLLPPLASSALRVGGALDLR